jgi:transposase-like protein
VEEFFVLKKNSEIARLTKKLMEENEVEGVADLQSILKEMLKQGVETLLEAELDEELGYEKYDNKIKKSNYRNGRTSKSVRTDLGEIDIQTPRDRNGDFEPQILPKNSRDISAIEDKVISMYGKGMTQRDISNHIEEIYGIPLSAQSVSRMTDKIIPLVEEWQNRALQQEYFFVFMDAIHYKVKTNNRIISKAAYVVVGIDSDGFKDVLGIWIGENETSKFWLKVLTDLKNRGVQKVHIFSVDGLPGFKEAIRASYPDSVVQRCIIHQIRYSTKYVKYTDIKELMADLKTVYTSPNEETGYSKLQTFSDKWASKYPLCVKSWIENWNELSPFFNYSEAVRKIMYTTNIIENLNRQYRKVTKGKPIFPTDDSLLKVLYLATQDATNKWTSRIRDWGIIKNELLIIHQ